MSIVKKKDLNHVVQEGESLFSIAQKYYGSSRGFLERLIYKDNEELIGKDSSAIEVDMELVVRFVPENKW